MIVIRFSLGKVSYPRNQESYSEVPFFSTEEVRGDNSKSCDKGGGVSGTSISIGGGASASGKGMTGSKKRVKLRPRPS